jgi:alkanesulfonate monooxygenase SsuD/methylene tetrahydromethanopterin reductase-like flavin-dependent oxidoreductase (luciferase family)
LWHPVLVAEQIGTLAAIAQGRFIMQCGLGWGEARFAAMGANIRTRPSAFEEALDIVRRLLAGETVSSSRASVSPKRALRCVRLSPSKSGSAPAQRRPSTARHGSRRAGSEEVRAQADIYRERCAAYSRQPGAIVLRRDIYVGESSSEAQAVLQHALSQYLPSSPASSISPFPTRSRCRY